MRTANFGDNEFTARFYPPKQKLRRLEAGQRVRYHMTTKGDNADNTGWHAEQYGPY